MAVNAAAARFIRRLRHGGRGWLELVLAVPALVILLLVTCGLSRPVLGGPHGPSEPREGGQIATQLPPLLIERLNPPRPPNIILIVADDLGYGDVGCYGQKKIRTPHIDRLAAEGMRFTQCYAGSCIGTPSRACLLTGFHTGHVRIRGDKGLALALEDVTVAEVLKSAGYQTGVIGQWGLGLETSTGTPHRQGFDEWLGYLDSAHAENSFPAHLWRSSVQNNVHDHALVLDGNLDGKQQVYAHDFLTMAATNFIRISKYQPFFLYLPLTLPHANRTNGMEVPDDLPYSREPWPQPAKNRAAMITRLDRSVGLILQQLTQLKLDTNTVLFFTSANGPPHEGTHKPHSFKSSGPWRGGKHDLYEGGHRVPMIARWPGHIPPGTVSDQVWAFWDFLPTAAALAGTPPPPDLDGLSFLPALLGRKQTNQHPYLYWEYPGETFKQALRIGDWKAIRLNPDQPWELYDLKSDPAEQQNLANQHPDRLQQFEALLKTARTDSERWPIPPPTNAVPKTAR